MQKQKEPAERKGIAAFALWSAIGCGIGAIVGGLIGWAIAESMGLGLEGLLVFLGLTYVMVGAGGGTALGLALKHRRVAVVALIGAVGVSIGLFISAIVSTYLSLLIYYLIIPDTPPLSTLAIMRIIGSTIRGGVSGAVGGAVLGLVLRGWKGAGFLALAGVVAGIIVSGAIVSATRGIIGESALANPQIAMLMLVPVLFILPVATGAAWGTALGYLEKRKAETQG